MSFRRRHAIPDLGVGVGFRAPHFGRVLRERPPMDWFEVISETFMARGGKLIETLERLRSHYPVVPHGVSLSIGGSEPLDADYLTRLKALADRLDAPWVSDHLCWTGSSETRFHELLPLPFTDAVIAHVVARVKRVQDVLGRPLALENMSSYASFRGSAMPEWEFISRVAEEADCGILLDVNNAYVSAYNHGFDAGHFIDAMPADRVVQMHLAGHTDRGAYLLDTHSDPVRAEVWDLYRRALARFGPTSTLVEWDENIPSWEVLAAEAQTAREARKDVPLLASAGERARDVTPRPPATDAVALVEVQRLFNATVSRVTPVDEDADLARETSRIVAPGVHLSPSQSLEVYRVQFWWRHVRALRKDFSTVARLLDRASFRRLCEGYLSANPPRSFTIRDVGDRLARFVHETLPWSLDTLLHDAARLDWAFLEAGDAAGAPALATAALPEAGTAWSRARFAFHPSVQLLEMKHPAHLLRADVARGGTSERPLPSVRFVVVHRGARGVVAAEVEDVAFALLVRLMRGLPLAAACEGAAASASDAARLESCVGRWFVEWTSRGWIRGVMADGDAP